MYFKQQTVTPEMAANMLSHNLRNRNINTGRVHTLTNDILKGNWTESHQPIAFDTDGNLLDGQHRLTAVVKSNTPVVMTVAYDVPKEAVIDKTWERNTGDALYMRGLISKIMSTRRVQAIVNRYLAIADNGASLSDNDKIEFINRNEENIIRTLNISAQGARGNCICCRAGIQTAILAALLNGVDEAELKSFAQIANTGFMEKPEQSAAIILRNYALENPITGASASNDLCACAQMAIRDFVNQNPRRSKYRRKIHLYMKTED